MYHVTWMMMMKAEHLKRRGLSVDETTPGLRKGRELQKQGDPF